MRIAFVYDSIFPYVNGGIERRIYEFALRLTRSGHEVHVFGPKFWDGPDVIMQNGSYLHGVCSPGTRVVNGKRSVLAPIKFALRVFFPLLRGKFDIIECPIFPYFPAYTSRLVSLIRRTPFVVSWFEIWENFWYEYLGWRGIFGKLIERNAIKLPHEIVVETEETTKSLVSWGFNRDHITSIPSGCPTHEYARLPASDAAQDKTDIIFTGRLVDYKRVDLIIDAVAVLKEKNINVKAAIIGDGPEMARLQERAYGLGITEQIRFHGFIEGLERTVSVMKASKIFVYAAAPLGGWALTPIEANACGLPVVTSAHGSMGLNEVVIHGYNGLVSEDETAEGIAEQISILLSDHSLRETLSQNAVEYAQQYDWDNLTQSLEELYKSCLDRRVGSKKG